MSIAFSAFFSPLPSPLTPLALLDGARHLDPHRDLAGDVALHLLRLRQQRNQLGDLVPAGEVLAIEVDHRAVARVELAHAAEGRLCLLHLAELLPQQIGELDQKRDVLLAALRARRRVEDLRQLGPALLRAQRCDHRAQGAVLDRVRLQRLLVVNQRLIRTAQLLGQLARGQLGDRAVFLGRSLLGAAAVESSSSSCLPASRSKRSRCWLDRRFFGSSSRLLRRNRSPSLTPVSSPYFSWNSATDKIEARRQRRIRRRLACCR